MAKLIAPNGVEVNASELDTPILLAAGYKPVEDEKPQPKAPRKRTVKKEQ